MQNLLATMVTSTSFGTWPPGDLRGYVEDGVILPSNPALLAHARSLMTSAPVYFSTVQRDAMCASLIDACDRYESRVLAVSIESWHILWLIDHRFDAVETMVGRLKTAMRKALAVGRIWTEGYDSRFCFTLEDVGARAEYINRHGGARVLTAPHGAAAW